MALSDIGLCSRALVKIGVHPITSFADGTAPSEIAGLLYDTLRDAVLSAYAWSFATGQVSLTKLGTAPTSDYAFAYQLPNDFLRAISAGSGSRSRGVVYKIVGDQLHSNVDGIVLSYIYRPAEESFPPYFDMVLIARIAAELCLPLTENVSRAEALSKLAEIEFSRARQIDAQQDSPNRLESFSLIDARE